MKLATLHAGSAKDGSGLRPVLVVQDGVIDIRSHLQDAPATVADIIAAFDTWQPRLQELAGHPADAPLDQKALAAPITRPGKIFAIGLNYADHVEETGLPTPEKQVWFTKAATSAHAPFAPIELPAASSQIDYEAELVVVIGRRCRNVPRDRAREVIFGYAVGNDVSVRDWQMATPQWSLGKSFDTHCPFGPWITTPDEIDVDNLGIRSYVNGELRQNSNTRHLIFKAEDMIAQLSQAMTLEPGDLIFTGTPGGVGMVWQGKPHFLKAGDVSRIEIDGLGAIEATLEPGSAETIL